MRASAGKETEFASPYTIRRRYMLPAKCVSEYATPSENVRRDRRTLRAEPITDHPFMRRLRREPVDLYKIWKLMANAQIGIVNGFSRRLAQVVAKVDEIASGRSALASSTTSSAR